MFLVFIDSAQSLYLLHQRTMQTGSTSHNSDALDNAGDSGIFGIIVFADSSREKEGPGLPPDPPWPSIFRKRKEESAQGSEQAKGVGLTSTGSGGDQAFTFCVDLKKKNQPHLA